MSEMQDFKIGDKVKHANIEDIGVVVATTGREVKVRFPSRNSTHDRPFFMGIYDENWFRVNSSLLIIQ